MNVILLQLQIMTIINYEKVEELSLIPIKFSISKVKTINIFIHIKKKFHLPFYYYLFIYTKTKNENKKLGDPS